MKKSASGFLNKVTPRKLIRKAASRADLRSLNEKVSLERVLGLTTTNSNGIACNPISGVVAYPAGCVIVLYNPKSEQQRHIINQEKKTITCLNFSGDGKYLASGECGQQPMVRVWELGETITQISELKGHKSGIISVEFSPNQKLLVSIGDHHDMLVNIWNWKGGHTVACNKSGCRVRSVSLSENGQYLVTVGNRHVKFWYLNSETSSTQNIPIAPITGRSGILGDQRNNCFTDVMCGRGKNSSFTYCVTKSGLLCLFSEKRILDKWVQLKAGCTNCLVVTEKHIYCGCSDGIIRVFNPSEIKFLATLPLPHKLGINVCGSKNQENITVQLKNYPDVVALAVDEHSFILSSVYNDHSLYIWDIHDVHNVHKLNSFLYHSACIWGVETYKCSGDDPFLPYGSFLTCSSDDTIRIWNMDQEPNESNVYFKNVYSKELLKIVYIDEGLSNLQDTSMTPLGKDTDSKNGVRCMQISPNGHLCAAGDRSGNLRIYNLEFFDEIYRIDAHESEILCVEFSDPKSDFELLATSSRDRLVHIFDVRNKFNLLQTIDDHSSSITAVRFNYDLDVLQLLSCGADKVVMFHTGQTNSNGSITFIRNTIVPGKSTLYDMGIDPTRKLAATVGQDRNMRIYDIQGAKQIQCFKGSQNEGNLIKLQLDPSGVYAAISCSDKTISIYDFSRGECESVILGHSELVTGLQFTSDGKRLISVAGDGCIFIWKLPTVFTENILNRLEELEIPFIPRECDEVDTHRKTFIISSPTLPDDESKFKTPPKDLSSHYRFSIGQLPVWARKQIGVENNLTNAKGSNAPLGRWGERTEEPLNTVLEIENKTVTYSTSLLEFNETAGNESKVLKLSDDSLNGDNERRFEVTRNQRSSSWKEGTDVTDHKLDSESESAESVNDHVNSEAAEDSFLESDYEDDAFSPLSEHFEKLGTPIVTKMLNKPNYPKNAVTLFNRASISAKFLSRSQKASRTQTASINDQRKRLEILKARFNNKINTNISTNIKSSMENIFSKDTTSRSNIQESKHFKSCQNISQSNSEKTFHRLLSSPSFNEDVSKTSLQSSTPWRLLDSKDHSSKELNLKQNVWSRSSFGKSSVKSPGFDDTLSVDGNYEKTVVLRKKGDNRRQNRPRSMFVESMNQKVSNKTLLHCLSDTETNDNEVVQENIFPNNVNFQSVNLNQSQNRDLETSFCEKKSFQKQHSETHESLETVYWKHNQFLNSACETNGTSEDLYSDFSKDQNLGRIAVEINDNICKLNMKSNYDDYTKNCDVDLVLKSPTVRSETIRSDSPPQRDTFLTDTSLLKNTSDNQESVSLVSCQNILHTFVKSYNDVRRLQCKVIEQPSSPIHSQIILLISKTYLALGNSMSEQREKLIEHLDLIDHQQDLIKSNLFQELESELLSNKESSTVLYLLEKYSNLLLDLTTTKIKEKSGV
ncbi:WD repeat-containing protein 62 isoform X1 [Hydra vulgaris]|nr:WD repeat-containing protein 62 isoform X1 [Hydra vulgaris]